MARIIVFNNDANRMENYYRNENEAMPYNANRTLKDHGNGGHGSQSQHYAGVAFDTGQRLSTAQRNRLWNTANSSRSMDLCRTTKFNTYLGRK